MQEKAREQRGETRRFGGEKRDRAVRWLALASPRGFQVVCDVTGGAGERSGINRKEAALPLFVVET